MFRREKKRKQGEEVPASGAAFCHYREKSHYNGGGCLSSLKLQFRLFLYLLDTLGTYSIYLLRLVTAQTF